MNGEAERKRRPLRRRRGSQLVESALIWPLIVLIVSLALSCGLEETALLREAAEAHGTEREARVFDMPGRVLSLSSLLSFSEASFSGASE